MNAHLEGRTLRVEKLRYDRSFVFAWSGAVLEHTPDHVLLAARFNAGRRDLGYVVLEAGDLFLEWYFFERWYNVFQIYSDEGQLKGWYCNIGMPPELDGDTLRYVDLDLDVFVQPSGEHLMLDEPEFAELKRAVLRPEESRRAEDDLAELLGLVADARLPSRPYATVTP